MIPSELTQNTQSTGPSRAWSLLVAATLFAAPQALRAQATATPPATDTTKPEAKQTAVVPAPAPAAPATEDDDTIVLSPFEVVADNKGYFSANTMSGTRLNSKIEDLGQPITVMTKEQMVDFAMLDINDVFDYMASTEGTGTYSDFALDRTGAVTDNVSGDPNNANRVRGIGNANIAFSNFQMTGRVPVDPLWMDSLELSRGPNANIFGLGNASGTVNQVAATANLTRDFVRTEARVDSYEGWRASIDVNRILIDDKLAVRGSLAYQHTGFIREPSGEDARRFALQAKAKPFANTTVSLSWYGYKNVAQRPNFTTPRDFITDWFEAGQPAWNPVTRLITIGGVTYGQGMVAGSTTPITTLPSYFVGHDARAVFRIGGKGEDPYWSTPSVTNTTITPQNPLGAAVNNTIRFVNTGPSDSLFGATQPLFASYRPLDDKSIYDWEKVNLMANSKAWDDVNTYLAQLDQVFLTTERQTLAGQIAFMREDVERTEDLPMGPASVNSTIGEIHIDPNIVNLDGSPNPYFGRPYARTTEPFKRSKPQQWDTTRVQAVYKFDFTRNEGWSRYLGTQQLLGYYEYKDQENRHYAWRNTAIGLEHPWQQLQFNSGIALANRATGVFNPTTGTVWTPSNNYMRLYEQYYLGDTPGGGIEYGPSFFPHEATVPLVWGQAGNFRSDSTTVGFTPSPDGSGGNASKQTLVKTSGAVLQSSFLDGRLVTTFGLREDKVSDRNAPFATLTPDMLDFNWAESNKWNDGWREARGKTKTASVVVRPFRDLGFVNNQKNSSSGFGRFFAEAVGGLSLTFNKSDNFIPMGPAVDLFLRPLPNQTGSSKDFGFWMTVFDGRLSLRYNHFKTDQIDYRSGDIATIAQRVLRADGLNAADAWNLQDRSTGWVTELNPGWTTEQVRAEVANIMGLPQETIVAMEAAVANGTLSATQDIESEGDELEINYNPSREWTISASVTKTESINKNAGSTIEDWIETRMPIWETVEDPRFDATTPVANTLPLGADGHLRWRYIFGSAFTTYGYNSTNSAASNFVTFVEGPLSVYRQLEGRPRPQMPKYAAKFSTKYQLSGISDNEILKGMSVGGSLRWTDKKAIGFYGVQSLPDKITELDTNRPVYSDAETYIDLFVSYSTKLFSDKVRARFQLNVKNVQESGGGLLVTQVFPDGTPLAYRIVDPRQFILSATFDF